MLTVERELPAQPANSLNEPGFSEYALAAARRKFSNAELPIIIDALSQCATAFGTDRARFIRQTADGEWVVYTLHQDSVSSHSADQAEIAMAWLVGLSRFPIRVTRPRVTYPDGSGIRPIAVTSYVGIPILCQNHFAGVIELAGSDTNDLERVLARLSDSLALLGYCLVHDPALRAPQHIDLDVECGLGGGFWSQNEMVLTPDEWSVLSLIGSPIVLRDAVSSLTLSDGRLIDVIRVLVSRGLVSVRASTDPLTDASDTRRPSSRIVRGDSL